MPDEGGAGKTEGGTREGGTCPPSVDGGAPIDVDSGPDTDADASAAVLGLIPEPRLVQPGTGAFVISPSTAIVVRTPGNSDVDGVARFLAERLRAATGFPIDVVAPECVVASRIELGLDPSISEDEGYRLDIDRARAAIHGKTAHGLFDGVQTLRQLFPPAIEGSSPATVPLRAPAVHIEDAPRFSYRGIMLDVSRHFFTPDFVKRFIDLVALYKINTLHWHLTDDQGWRIEIKKYPLLTQVGAYRDDGMGGRYGGFYTQDQIRDVVAYAAERFVTVVPEIEMPGHCSAALAAYPKYSCTGGPFKVETRWSGITAVYCPSEETFQFLGDVLAEVMDLFPSQLIHVGGDEVAPGPWTNSALAMQVMQREGLMTIPELQAYFTKRIADIVAAKQRRIIGWDDILNAKLNPTAAIMSWHGSTPATLGAQQAHDAVLSPSATCYLDHYQADPTTEPPAHGGKQVTLPIVYGFDPMPAGLSATEAAHILGAQGNLWSEYVPTGDHAAYMTFPREMALAEITWSPKAVQSYTGFVDRLRVNVGHLDMLGVNYAKHY
jgi:hexosaminidase